MKELGNKTKYIYALAERSLEDFARHRMDLGRKWLGALTPADVVTMWEKQGGRCALSGQPMTYKIDCPNRVTLDHKRPKSRGGKSVKRNAQLVCRWANELKHDMLAHEFISKCRDIVAYAEGL